MSVNDSVWVEENRNSS